MIPDNSIRKRAKKVVDAGSVTLAHLQESIETNELLQELVDKEPVQPEIQKVEVINNGNDFANLLFQSLKGEKGDKGDSRTEEELINIITPLIPEPIKGNDGRDGKDGVDGKDGKDGNDGRDGKDGVDGKDGNSISTEEIISKFEGDIKFPMSHVQDLDETIATLQNRTQLLNQIATQGQRSSQGGSTTFTGLTDTPDSYTGQGTKFVRVNGAETALEFATVAGGGDALTSAPLSQFAATTSAQLAGVISDETGTGALVFANSPVFTTPNIGTATGNITGNAATVTTNANLTGHITSTGNATILGSFTKAQLDTAVSDGNVLYVGDITQYTDEMAQDATGAMVDTSLVYVDATPLLTRAALTGDVTASQGSNATTIANAAVTLAKMANLAQDQFIGRVTASTGVPETATITAAARTVLDDTTVGAMVDTLGGAASTGTGGLVRTSTPTVTTPVINGLATGTGVATLPTASTIVLRDSNANISVNNIIRGFTTTVTAAGTTTLTVASTQNQYFTGTNTQIVQLPVVSTLTLGHNFRIVNDSTGAVTINSSGGNEVIILASGTSAIVTCILTIGTTAASWNFQYDGEATASGKKLTVSNTMTLTSTDGVSMNVSNNKIAQITMMIGDGVSAISANATSFVVPCTFAGTITAYTIAADAGTCTIKTWKKATGTAIPTSADSISTSGVSLSTGTLVRSTTVSDFTTTTVTANDVFIIQATSVATAKYISFTLEITKS